MSRKKSPFFVRGFTLIELLVVVVIIGVAVGAVMLSFNSGPSRVAREEAQRITALLSLAAQESIITSREMALEWSEDEYQFLVYDGTQWMPYQDNVFRARTLPENMRLSFSLQSEESLFSDKKTENKPRIYIMSSGEMTPFELLFDLDDSDEDIRVSGDMSGNLVIEGEQ